MSQGQINTDEAEWLSVVPPGSVVSFILIGILSLGDAGAPCVLAVGAGFLLDKTLRGNVHESLFSTALMLASLLAGSIIAGLVRDRIWAGLQGRVLANLRQGIYARLQAVSVSFLDHANDTELPKALTSHLDTFETGFNSGLREGLTPALQCVLFTAVIAWADWHSAVVALFFWPWGIFAPSLIAGKAAAAAQARSHEEAKIRALLEESIDARYVVRAFSLQQSLATSFRKRTAPVIRLISSSSSLEALAARLPVAGMLLLQLVFLCLGMILLADRQLWAGQLLILQLMSLLLCQALFRLSAWLPVRLAAMQALASCEDLLDDPADVAGDSGSKSLSRIERELAVVANGFDLRIPQGSYVALTGVSGEGKTLVLSLMMRLGEPTSGTVSIDGMNVRELKRSALRSRIALVPQQDFFFHASVMENIRVGRADASAEVVADVAKAIGLHALVTAMPRGYDTVIGGKGVVYDWDLTRLISLARALIRNPEVLLLDDFATPDDAELLAWIAVGRTLVVTTQRAEVACLAPYIFVLSGGTVVEQGTYKELLDADGMYAWMFRRQSGFDVTPDGLHASVEPERLRLVPALEHLPLETLEELSAYFSTEHFRAGQEIVRAEELQAKLYLIVRGTVETPGPQPLLLHDGDVFGEESLSAGLVSPATFRARTDCICLALERCHFLNL